MFDGLLRERTRMRTRFLDMLLVRMMHMSVRNQYFPKNRLEKIMAPRGITLRELPVKKQSDEEDQYEGSTMSDVSDQDGEIIRTLHR